jgi:3-phenylpropionate/trans-cinnamate dioxygenase ferredoxin reductase component
MHIVILGNGVAGITAAIHIRRWSNYRITVISAESDFFFSRTALMYVFMGHMRLKDTEPYERTFWEKQLIQRLRASVTDILMDSKTVRTSDGQLITYDKLVIATGSRPAMPGIPGEQLPGIQGFYHLQDLDSLETAAALMKKALIIGGGLIGLELAEMLHSRHIPLTMLIREEKVLDFLLPPPESDLVERHIRNQGIDIRLGTGIRSFTDESKGRLSGALTLSGEHVAADFAGITIGVRPNIAFLEGSGLETRSGVLTDEYLQTNVPDVFAAGDCVELRNPPPGSRATEALWYTARSMGEAVARNICQPPTPYQPGIWFNSAKFFHLEYQVYGHVPLSDNDPEYDVLGWQHPEGHKSIRVGWHRTDKTVSGFLLLGIRYRQEVCEQWISRRTPIDWVLKHLHLANFDPELAPRYEKELLKQVRR